VQGKHRTWNKKKGRFVGQKEGATSRRSRTIAKHQRYRGKTEAKQRKSGGKTIEDDQFTIRQRQAAGVTETTVETENRPAPPPDCDGCGTGTETDPSNGAEASCVSGGSKRTQPVGIFNVKKGRKFVGSTGQFLFGLDGRASKYI